ncbi:MAG TPA: PQQ-binding-like beta-propeller repeat protein [Acidimicrobiales bacterium]|nr:PQQ-binding-like beta-propeller repeat protein [Acidimicrobiales bacterium]
MKAVLVPVYRLICGITIGVLLVSVTVTVSPSSSASAPASWAYPNGDLANTRNATTSSINLANVEHLKEAWTFQLRGKATASVGGYGTLAANPIVQDGVVYMQDLHSNVYALSLSSGHLLWEHDFNKPELSGPGPNGVAVDNGDVYGETPHAAFALNAANGKLIWSNDHLLAKGQGTFGIQPQVSNGQVFLASQYGSAPGGGLLIALNAATGHEEWSFKTMTGPEPGVRALGLGAGGAWETPLVSSDGTVTYGIGNPYQSVGEAYAQPARLLYSDSDVSLNAVTGKLNWYYQGVENDFKDYDMQASPIAASVDGTSVVIGGGKMGYVYEMNASSGALIWKRAVGVHNGDDQQSLKALKHTGTLKLPFTYLPGALGGILTNMAYANGTIYAATINLPLRFTTSTQVNGQAPTGSFAYGGDLVALNAATGAIEWSTKLKGIPDGGATVSNDLVFTALVSGRLIACNRATGAIVLNKKLPRSMNSTLAIAGNTVIVPTGGPVAKGSKDKSQIVAYTVPAA